MFKDLLPSTVSYYHATPSMWDTPVNSDEEAHVAKAVEKRKREYRAGRHAARRALRQLDPKFNESSFSILSGEKRQPLWPDNIVGTITHSDNQCYAAVANKSDIRSIGIDVEKAEPLKENLIRMICTAEEQDWLRTKSDWLSWAKLIFSAKESVYKTYFPICESYLDFLQATLTIDATNRTFSAKILVDASTTLGTQTLDGRFIMADDFVYTAVWF